jgi:hypothetical protein
MKKLLVTLSFLTTALFATATLAAPPEGDTSSTGAVEVVSTTGEAASTSGDATPDTSGGEAPVAGDLGVVASSTGGEEDSTGSDSGAVDTTGGETGPAEIASDEEAVAAAKALFGALQVGDIPLAVALGLMLLVYIVRRTHVADMSNAWIAAGLSVVGYVAADLLTAGAGNVLNSVMSGLMAGIAAAGLGELVVARLMSGKAEPAKAEPAKANEEKSE